MSLLISKKQRNNFNDNSSGHCSKLQSYGPRSFAEPSTSWGKVLGSALKGQTLSVLSVQKNSRLENKASLQNKDNIKWPLWKKISIATIGLLTIGVLVNFYIRSRNVYNPEMCREKEYTAITSVSDSCIPKNLLNFFNKYFPNVVVIGADSDVGKETLQWMDHLNIKYSTLGTYDKSTIPFEVWGKSWDYVVSEELRQSILSAERQKRSYTWREADGADKLRGVTACFLNHRRAVLDTINKYNEAVKEIDRLNSTQDFPGKEDELKAFEAQKQKYSSIFVMEHNARFGTVKKDGTVELSSETAQGIERSLKALPEDWEYFTLFTFDWQYDMRPKTEWNHLPSKEFPGVFSVSEKDILVHPSNGAGAKAYAWSYRSYKELEHLFSEINENEAFRNFKPIDNEFPAISESHRKNGRRYQLGTVKSLMYRLASPSFHEKYFQDKHFPSTSYINNEEKVNFKF